MSLYIDILYMMVVLLPFHNIIYNIYLYTHEYAIKSKCIVKKKKVCMSCCIKLILIYHTRFDNNSSSGIKRKKNKIRQRNKNEQNYVEKIMNILQ